MGIKFFDFKKKAVKPEEKKPEPEEKKNLSGQKDLISVEVKEEKDGTVTTDVDELIRLLSDVQKISVDEAAKKLNIPKNVLQSWIEFLVEEKIIGIEYSFTTPYIYLNRPKESQKTKKTKEEKMTYSVFKKDFYDKAIKDKIPEAKIEEYWQNHLKEKLEMNKEFFIREARKRNLPMMEKLWDDYSLKAKEAK
jgi:predicted transcriptional regulator